MIQATQRTLHWLERCISAKQRSDQALFAIVQGGVYADLRRECTAAMLPYDLPGYAIGGVSVGEPNSAMHEIVAVTAPLLPAHKPRYLMGVGTHLEMLRAIAAGVDLFDCVIPTRFTATAVPLSKGSAGT